MHLFTRGRALLNRLAHESFDVLRTIRSQTVSDTPVLFLNHRDAEADVVAALEAGAAVLETGPIRIDVGRREITRDGEPVD